MPIFFPSINVCASVSITFYIYPSTKYLPVVKIWLTSAIKDEPTRGLLVLDHQVEMLRSFNKFVDVVD